METGNWLSVCPTSVANTTLSASEFCDSLHLRYALELPNLPCYCDGCGAPFSKEHALQCKTGGLVILCHNEVRDEWASLCAAAFTPSAVRNEPLIELPLPMPNPPQSPTPTAPPNATTPPVSSPAPPAPVVTTTAERGDLLVRGFFTPGTDCIFDIRIQDLDAPSYVNRASDKCLLSTEQAKKKQYLKKCQDQRRTFVPFVVSVDGLLAPEAANALKQLAKILSAKWQRPYSAIFGYVKSRIGLSVIRGAHLCLRGSRVKASSMSTQRYLWDDAEGVYCLHNQHF